MNAQTQRHYMRDLVQRKKYLLRRRKQEFVQGDIRNPFNLLVIVTRREHTWNAR